MSVASVGSHVEDDVLERSRLGNLPMNTGSGIGGLGRGVEDEVTDLAVEVVLVRVPVSKVLSAGCKTSLE